MGAGPVHEAAAPPAAGRNRAGRVASPDSAQPSSPLSDGSRTDRAGFEPAVPLARYAGLANRCLQPLGHLSGEVRILPPHRGIVKLRRGRPDRRCWRLGRVGALPAEARTVLSGQGLVSRPYARHTALGGIAGTATIPKDKAMRVPIIAVSACFATKRSSAGRTPSTSATTGDPLFSKQLSPAQSAARS